MTSTTSGINLDPAIEKKLLGAFVIALVTVALMAAAAIQNNSRQAQSAAWVDHTHAFILATDAIQSSLHAAEAAQRVYMQTGDDATRLHALERFAEVDENYKVAAQLALGNPSQLQRLESLSTLLQRVIDFNKQAAQTRSAAIFTNAQHRAALAEIKTQIEASKAAENALLLQREQTLNRHTSRTEQILYAGAGLNIVLLGLAFYIFRLDLNLRRQATAILEQKVLERTAELAAANEKLQIEYLEQKWGQAALSRVVRHHELILNSIREGIVVISRTGHIISANAAASEMLGPELGGKPIGNYIQKTDGTRVPWDQHFLAAALRSGQPVVSQSAYCNATPVCLSAHPAVDNENLTGAVITISPA